MFNKIFTPLLILLLSFLLTSCGFHLRGTFAIPPILKILRICPEEPFDPFQRLLRQTLKTNEITIVPAHCKDIKAAVLTLSQQAFTERVVGYGSDIQADRAVLQFSVTYQVQHPDGKILLAEGIVKVERDLPLNPNAVLGTDNERNRVKNELLNDAVLTLLRQLSATCL